MLNSNDLFDIFSDEFVEQCNRNMRYPVQDAAFEGASDQSRMRMFSNAFVVGGLCAVLQQWTAEDFESSPEDIVRSMQYLIPNMP